MKFGRTAIGVSLVVLVGTASCALLPSGETPTPAVSNPSPTAPPVREEYGGLDLECDDLAPVSLVTSVVGDVTAWDHRSFGVNSQSPTWAALEQDGGLDCKWLASGAVGDYLALGVTVLPDASEFFDEFRGTALERPDYTTYREYALFDGALVGCFGYGADSSTGEEYGCDWQILAGDVWLSLQFWDIGADEVAVTDAGTPDELVLPVVDGSASFDLIGTMVESTTRAPRLASDRDSAGIPTCAELAPASDTFVDKATEYFPRYPWTTGDEAGGRFSADGNAQPFNFSYERLGFRDCSVQVDYPDGGYRVRFLVTRGLDWLLRDPYPESSLPHHPIDGGELYDNCGPEELTYEMCSTLVVSGDLIITFDTAPEVSEIVAQELLANLGE